MRGNQVLLAEKQQKIGAGRLNGFGGRREPSDTSLWETNSREVEEEVGLRLLRSRQIGEIAFTNPSDDPLLQRMIVGFFIAHEWEGEPQDSDEMKKARWYNRDSIDFGLLLPADRLFVPMLLAGQSIKGIVVYDEHWNIEKADFWPADFPLEPQQ